VTHGPKKETFFHDTKHKNEMQCNAGHSLYKANDETSDFYSRRLRGEKKGTKARDVSDASGQKSVPSSIIYTWYRRDMQPAAKARAQLKCLFQTEVRLPRIHPVDIIRVALVLAPLAPQRATRPGRRRRVRAAAGPARRGKLPDARGDVALFFLFGHGERRGRLGAVERRLLLLLLHLLLLLGCLHGLLLQLAHERVGLSGEFAFSADRWAVLVEEERKRDARDGQEGRDRRRPVDAQVLVHVGGEQGEGGAEQGPQDRVCSQDGRGEDGVRVDQVVHDTEEDEDHAEAEGDAGRDAGHPVDGRVVGPGEPEQADGNGNRCNQAGWEAGLGRREPAVLGLRPDVALVVGDGVRDGEEHADHDAQEGETPDALVPPAVQLVYDRERGEEHVERSVDDGHVDGKEQDNGLPEEENPRA